MTVLVQSIRQIGTEIGHSQARLLRRLTPVAALVAVISVVPGGWDKALNALSDAYLSVSVFVAGTLALVYAAERAFNTDFGALLMRYHHWQVPAGALLGAFPGCGGAIVAMTQYIRGNLTFGSVVATLTATMGDAMFLLLAREPMTGLGILVMGIVVGMVSGYVVDVIHGPDFMRATQFTMSAVSTNKSSVSESGLSVEEKSWVALMIPGVVIGMIGAPFIWILINSLAPLFLANPATGSAWQAQRWRWQSGLRVGVIKMYQPVAIRSVWIRTRVSFCE